MRDINIFDTDRSICRFARVREDSPDGFGEAGKGSEGDGGAF